nr:hypothetical protein [uncultured Pseudomonas sp.]
MKSIAGVTGRYWRYREERDPVPCGESRALLLAAIWVPAVDKQPVFAGSHAPAW